MSALPNYMHAPGAGDIRGALLQKQLDDDAARADAVSKAAEAIAADSAKVRQLVDDNIGNDGGPMCSDMAVDLAVNLRNLQPLLADLCKGDTVEQATKAPERLKAWRLLLAHAKTVDLWIDELIAEEAEGQS